MRSFLKGLALALLITCLGTAALALIFTDTAASEPLITALAVLVKLLSVAAGTLVTVRGIKKRGALCGLALSCAWFFLTLALSVLLGAAVWEPVMLLDLLATLVCGTFSGILSAAAVK